MDKSHEKKIQFHSRANKCLLFFLRLSCTCACVSHRAKLVTLGEGKLISASESGDLREWLRNRWDEEWSLASDRVTYQLILHEKETRHHQSTRPLTTLSYFSLKSNATKQSVIALPLGVLVARCSNRLTRERENIFFTYELCRRKVRVNYQIGLKRDGYMCHVVSDNSSLMPWWVNDSLCVSIAHLHWYCEVY